MKRPQFSLATLLICMTILAVLAAICVQVPVTETSNDLGWPPDPFKEPDITVRAPTAGEIALRLALWGPASIGVTLAILWAVRRFRSR